MVHQHFRLIRISASPRTWCSGSSPAAWLLLDRERATDSVRRVIGEYGFAIDPGLRVRELTVGRCSGRDHQDPLPPGRAAHPGQPTSVLTEQQIQKLFRTLRGLQEIARRSSSSPTSWGGEGHRPAGHGDARGASWRCGRRGGGRAGAFRLMVGKSVSLQCAASRWNAGGRARAGGVSLVAAAGPPLLDGVDLAVHAARSWVAG